MACLCLGDAVSGVHRLGTEREQNVPASGSWGAAGLTLLWHKAIRGGSPSRSVCLSVCLSCCLSILMSVYVYLSILLSICLLVYLAVCLPVSMSVIQNPASGDFVCQTCGRACRSRIGLYSHSRTKQQHWHYRNRLVHHHVCLSCCLSILLSDCPPFYVSFVCLSFCLSVRIRIICLCLKFRCCDEKLDLIVLLFLKPAVCQLNL